MSCVSLKQLYTPRNTCVSLINRVVNYHSLTQNTLHSYSCCIEITNSFFLRILYYKEADNLTMDVIFWRDTVLEIILSGKHISPEVYQLRFNLFLRAASRCFSVGKENREVLEPFPYFFYDCVTKQRNYDELKSCILSIPQLSQITVRNWFFVLFS